MENLYEILEVSKNASPEVIEKAYKTLVKKYHPDVAKDKEQAEKMMKKLNSAYEILSNPDSKAEYDFNLEQEENRLNINKKNNSDMSYNQYYNVQNQQEENNSMYSNNYNSESDYANNLKIFKRILNLNLDKDTKIILTIILGIIILLIINLFTNIIDLFGGNENKKNISSESSEVITEKNDKENSEEYEIDDITPINIVNEFLNSFKEYNFNNINQYIEENAKLSENDINILYKNKDIYQYIISHSDYSIKEYTVTNKKATVVLEINRFDVESAIANYYWSKLYNLELIDDEVETEEIVKFLKENIDKKVYRQITITVNNLDNEWKINLTYSNIKGLLGTEII